MAQVKWGQWVCQLRNPLQINELNRKADCKVSGNEQMLYGNTNLKISKFENETQSYHVASLQVRLVILR